MYEIFILVFAQNNLTTSGIEAFGHEIQTHKKAVSLLKEPPRISLLKQWENIETAQHTPAVIRHWRLPWTTYYTTFRSELFYSSPQGALFTTHSLYYYSHQPDLFKWPFHFRISVFSIYQEVILVIIHEFSGINSGFVLWRHRKDLLLGTLAQLLWHQMENMEIEMCIFDIYEYS